MMGAAGLRRRLGFLGICSILAFFLLYFWQFDVPRSETIIQGERPAETTQVNNDEPQPEPQPQPQPETEAEGEPPKPYRIFPLPEFPPSPSPPEVVDQNPLSIELPQGTFVGYENIDPKLPQVLQEFLNIPYAAPPTGALRFRPPVPPGPSDNTFNASIYGPRCPAGPTNAIPQDEDCLTLNIYRAKHFFPDRKLPVVIHFHGGAFNFGYAQTRNIPALVGWATEPMIGITFNYRIGALGFLPSKLMQKEGLLNLGLKDQELLLQWVQENIAAFGGDPENVTLMGLSAGAHSIGHHMMHITDDRPPFARVIIESGATTSRAVYHPDNPLHEKQFKEFLELLKIADVPEDQIMEVLRSTPIEFIKRASEKIFEDYNHSLRWPFQPVIDGKGGIIALPPIESWHQGLFHKVPIMTGFTTNEGTMFAPHNLSSSEDFIDYFHTLLPGLSEDDLSKLDKLYPDPTKRSLEEAKEPSDDSRGSEKPLDDSKSPDTPHEKREEPAENPERPEKSVPLAIEDGKAVPLIPFTNDQKPNPKSGPPPIRYLETRPGFGLQYTRLSAAYGHFAYICPVRQTVQFLSGSDHSRHERRLVKRQTPPEFEPPPIYLYQFAANTSVDYGSKHSDHAGFTTYSPEMYYKSPTTRDIAGNMHAYWSSFILSGSPNGVRRTNWGERSEWPSYTDKEAQGKKIIFGRGNDEIAGGGGKGVVTRVTYDDWPIKECEFWWERTHLFES